MSHTYKKKCVDTKLGAKLYGENGTAEGYWGGGGGGEGGGGGGNWNPKLAPRELASLFFILFTECP